MRKGCSYHKSKSYQIDFKIIQLNNICQDEARLYGWLVVLLFMVKN